MLRTSIPRLAKEALQLNPLKPNPVALLPPLPLYRRLFRAHRKHLPSEMRLLGDEYIKKEFRLHRNVDNPVHLVGFLTEWQLYAQQIEGDQWEGAKVDQDKLAKMSDEQIAQLYELMQAIQNRHKGGGGEGEEEGSSSSSSSS